MGVLENLAFDGRGGVLVSEQAATGGTGSVLRVSATGGRSAIARVDGPAGLQVSGNTVYVATGASVGAGTSGARTGTISTINLTKGNQRPTPVVTGLIAPNGLAVLPSGRFVTSRDIGNPTHLTESVVGGRSRPVADLNSTNGLTFDAPRNLLWVSTTFTPRTELSGLDPTTFAVREKVTIPGAGIGNGADDLTVGPDGNVYVALNSAGAVIRVDPRTRQTCTLANRLPLVSSVRFGIGPGWDQRSLYATSFLGTITQLSP